MDERNDAGLVEGRFFARRNRFAADVETGGVRCAAHVPNSGRMTELLVEGAPVLLRPATARPNGSLRRTAFDLVMVSYRGRWVGIDARVPPGIVAEAWKRGLLLSLVAYTDLRHEVRYGESRLDLLLEGPPGRCYVEAKSVNLVEDGVALFPDAPTTRGVRHLRELARAVEEGHRGAVVFVVQRDDAQALSPNPTADPGFAAALRDVTDAGVEPYAIACTVTPRGLAPERLLPVLLPETVGSAR